MTPRETRARPRALSLRAVRLTTIDYNYDQVYDAFTGISSDASNSKGQVFEEFVVGVLKMFGAATVGGYLDVGLIQRTASRLFEGLKDVAGKVDTMQHEVGDMEAKVRSVQEEVDVKKMIREGHALLRDEVTNLAWERLKEMPTGRMRDSDKAKLHLLRG